ncbi:type II toxin-antitoxin system VapC family toxin [uncultured Thiohalocapsa sp.]|uniref:type II toxin-antitoxin system VapC family toxin n=1 Tax=uncultured Thiohalocapsa sp. TaxID=768990 RepID=UPI0025DC7D9D|nr:type II toxin-antitoxin system VapC family toxin [uncultured Thiohalocapsa sp.]
MTASPHVIDASALLAYLHDEPGGSRVRDCLDGALITSVNLCEVVQKAQQFGADTTGLDEDLTELGIRIEPFSVRHALIAAELWQITRVSGLSLADRACLVLAVEQEAPVLTADRVWEALDLPVVVEVIR